MDRIADEMQAICAAEAEGAKFERVCDCKGFKRLNGLEFDSQDLRELDIRECPACKKPFKKKDDWDKRIEDAANRLGEESRKHNGNLSHIDAAILAGAQRPKKHIAEQFHFPFAGDHRITISVDNKLIASVTVGIKPKNLKEVVRVLLEAIDFEESPVIEDKDLI